MAETDESKKGIYPEKETPKGIYKTPGDQRATKPMVAVHDNDLNLGYQLHVADATQLGRDVTVLKQLPDSAGTPGAGKGSVSGGPASGNSGANYGASSNSGDNSGMHSTGTSSSTGTTTDNQVGTRNSGAAATDSNSADERKQ